MARRSPLFVVFFTILLDLVGFGLILPSASYYALQFHASESEVTLLGASFSAMQFLFVPFWGRLSDRIGRRPVLLASIAGSAVAMCIFGAARSYAWLIAARAFAGATTANFAVAQAYIADVTTDEDRARGMGLMGAAFGLGFILGPAIGGQLAVIGKSTGLGYGLVGYGSAALAALNFLLALAFLPEPETRRPRTSEPLMQVLSRMRNIAGLRVLVALAFVATFAFANMEWTFALLTRARLDWTADHGGEQKNAMMLVMVGVIAVVVQGGFVGRLARRFAERRLLLVGLVLSAVGFVGLAIATTLSTFIVATAVMAVGNSLIQPMLSTLVSRRAPLDLQGGTLGVQQAAGALARVAGPLCGGLLFQHIGPQAPYFTGGSVLAIAFLVAQLWLHD